MYMISYHERKSCFSPLVSLSLAILVGLEKTFYYFSEASAVNSICIEVFGSDCPISFPITVILTTSDDTAS